MKKGGQARRRSLFAVEDRCHSADHSVLTRSYDRAYWSQQSSGQGSRPEREANSQEKVQAYARKSIRWFNK